MELKTTFKISLTVYFIGLVYFYFRAPTESLLWFALGGGLAAINVFFAAWMIQFGFKSTQKKGIFLALLLFKSFSFLVLIAIILMFLKPLLLPFTLGLGVVIFSSVIAALWDVRRLLRPKQKDF